MKTRNRTSAKYRIFAAIIFAVLFFSVGYMLISRAAPKELSDIEQRIRQDLVLTFDGIEVAQPVGKFEYADGQGRAQSFSLYISGAGNTINQSDFAGELEFACLPYAVQVSAFCGGEMEFSGGLKDFSKFIPKNNGEYQIVVSAEFKGKDYSGSCEYKFTVAYNAETEFFLTASDVISGDALIIIGKNLRSRDVTVALDYEFTPFLIFDKDGGCSGYIPVNHLRTAGRYRAAVAYGGRTTELFYNVTEAEFEQQHMQISEATRSATTGNPEAGKEYSEVLVPLFESFDENIYWDGRLFMQPVEGVVTTDFGAMRYTNNDPTPSRHAGVDIACDEGTPVAASNTGKVLFAGNLIITGNTVLIEHGIGLHTLYQHLSRTDCEAGDIVDIGDIIGAVGSTGYSTGAHLHFDLMIGYQSINPWMAFDGISGIYELFEKR